MYYDKNNKILYKEQPPVPWNKFYGFLVVEDSLANSKEVDKNSELEVEFIYNGHNYNQLVEYLIN